MKHFVSLLSFIIIITSSSKLNSQQYSFSILAFSIYNEGKLVKSIREVKGFENHLKPVDMDSLSCFSVKAVYYNEDIQYHRIAKHKEGIWLLYAENVRKHRPIRFFSIEKKIGTETKVMHLFLNYDYHSCKMPCLFGKSDFLVSEIPFREGSYLLFDRLNLMDWETNNNKILKIEGDIFYYIVKNRIELWDIKMKN